MRFWLAACLILAGARLDACDCKPPPPPKKAMEGAEAVFLGEATEVEVEGQTPSVGSLHFRRAESARADM